jgi:hypothetical protein
MKKIPTLFERDWKGDPARVIDQVHPGCEWVLAGEGKPTLKQDGTCCMIQDGNLFKRRELRGIDRAPSGFRLIEFDVSTDKSVGWVPVGDGPEDRYHREAFAEPDRTFPDGTYELLGPKIQGNPERASCHTLIPHGVNILADVPRTFDGLRAWLQHQDMEGVVFHHPDGRMAKIKLRDFGYKRQS